MSFCAISFVVRHKDHDRNNRIGLTTSNEKDLLKKLKLIWRKQVDEITDINIQLYIR